MKKNIIIISDNDSVYTPTNVQMRDFEIAGLFGVIMPTVKSNIRAILKMRVITEDLTNGATLVGNNILPDYFGLDMVIALAFRIQSYKADVFRKWILRKVIEKEQSVNSQIFISLNNKRNNVLN